MRNSFQTSAEPLLEITISLLENVFNRIPWVLLTINDRKFAHFYSKIRKLLTSNWFGLWINKSDSVGYLICLFLLLLIIVFTWFYIYNAQRRDNGPQIFFKVKNNMWLQAWDRWGGRSGFGFFRLTYNRLIAFTSGEEVDLGLCFLLFLFKFVLA
jgi:hypothetical protein